MIKGKRGFYNQLMIVVVLGMVLGGIMLLFWIGGMVLPIISQTSGDLNSIIQSASTDTGDANMSMATEASFGNVNKTVQNFEWVYFTLIIFVFITFIAMCFYVRTYPFLAFVWLLIIFILVFISIFLASSYQDVSATGDLGYSSYQTSGFYMSYMPYIFAVIGIIGGIVMFILATRDQEAEAQQL